MSMPFAPTQRDHSTAHVIRDTLEMELFVKVTKEYYVCMAEPVFFPVASDKLIDAHALISSKYSVWFAILAIVFFSTDVNECSPSSLSSEYQHLGNICHDDANCTNTKGSYYCTCLVGYSGDGVTCQGEIFLSLFLIATSFKTGLLSFDALVFFSIHRYRWMLSR